MKFLCLVVAFAATVYAEEPSTKDKRGLIGSLGYGGLGGYSLGHSGLALGHGVGLGGLGLGHGVALSAAPVVSHAAIAPVSLGHGLGYGLGGWNGGLGLGYGGYSSPLLTKTIAAPIVTKTYAAPAIAAPISYGHGLSVGYSGLGHGW